MLGKIRTDPPDRPADDSMTAAVAFRAIAPHLDMLSAAERQLLSDWLDRAINAL